MRLPASTYRLQIRSGFGLDEAARVADYVRALGADWLYLSPLLRAEPGSDHGYDVVDHSQVDPERGGAVGLAHASRTARAEGLGVLIDIVPNHMGVATPSENSWWWDLLKNGRASRYASAFDVDWEAGGGRLRVPILGDGASDGDSDSELDALTIVGDELHYYTNRLPIAPGTAGPGDSGRAVHARQSYELVNWRRADAELNYRRFFAVNTLAALTVERPEVFDASHREIVRWFTEGLADGLRVDHPDGLADPGGYLDDLARAIGGAPVWVEKILEGDEELPPHWATVGTTGYDALADIDRILVDPDARPVFEGLDAEMSGGGSPVAWADLIHGTKRGIADGILRSEVLRLARLLPGISGADDAVAELLATYPVYRSYLPYGAEHLEHARIDAIHRRPEIAATLDEVAAALSETGTPVSMRFQQTSGMVMAKGVEDTAFYRFSRLTSLNEVGADPDEFAIDLVEFHRRQGVRQASFPASLTTLSTHDTKRGEDTRARITALAEDPGAWATTLRELHGLVGFGDGAIEHLLWEAVVGTWPASRERLHAYAEKASREADDSTHWTAPDEAFEERMHAAIDAAFDHPAVRRLVEETVSRVSAAGWSNGLAAKLVQITAPGIPDVYQGSELWETSLVDPDNRREVDFGRRRTLLERIDGGWKPAIDAEGAAKLLVTSRALRLRRDRPELFTRYAGVPAIGPAAEHAVAFDRGGALTVATRLPTGLAARGGWDETVIVLPGHPVEDVLTGRTFAGGVTPVAELLADYPVALLAPIV
ncbi:malto-oligosyltrehalose synthase [Rathayibacter iranicus]|uniref:Malto-oligosyltrehalose synthase n=2 Tax=Rathayibacter iranicus TaxID=59737 RepID=A0AAD1EM53_9MICO|nr:malto-oligosyltrehalose synthase [Rathayibacter iranicus]AZZ55199.1 malto-oligosyltrehalose synthase [Rathayibacter iranicus]MWV31562.1 malto-oligosyltrehalose synthase [Rathayibacter iranicus NCPPB 2253 = VKM Ac-1602]PPI49332.1 malto-oligosyltrehalose synthase [Rathayibacter iranicus]PPI61590.1 malto-oligosyltrehalose synthase [Rathayibacter iranicus]PPI72098.1 malto-oligosyltrehalose synthase [Rathayibacter iranicus]